MELAASQDYSDDDLDDDDAPEQTSPLGGPELVMQGVFDFGRRLAKEFADLDRPLHRGVFSVIPVTKHYTSTVEEFARKYVNPLINILSMHSLPPSLAHVDKLSVMAAIAELRRYVFA